MSVVAVAVAPRSRTDNTPGMRLVVVAASLGTVFEWYDFFLYGSLASGLLQRPVLSARQRDRGVSCQSRHLRCRIRGAAPRRPSVWCPRRSHRA
jgi:hypothetical protein